MVGFAVSEIKCVIHCRMYNFSIALLTPSHNIAILSGITLILKGQSVSTWVRAEGTSMLFCTGKDLLTNLEALCYQLFAYVLIYYYSN